MLTFALGSVPRQIKLMYRFAGPFYDYWAFSFSRSLWNSQDLSTFGVMLNDHLEDTTRDTRCSMLTSTWMLVHLSRMVSKNRNKTGLLIFVPLLSLRSIISSTQTYNHRGPCCTACTPYTVVQQPTLFGSFYGCAFYYFWAKWVTVGSVFIAFGVK